MEELLERRCADPLVVQNFFQAIDSIRKQRQIANIARIVKYMEREFTLKPIDSLKSLHNAVVDGLVIETITVGCKGSKAGVEQEGYWIPDKEQMLYDKEGESHDWYCFVCHKPGKVLSCAACPLAYHPGCIGADCEESFDSSWICLSCATVNKEKNKHEHNELGRCLNFIVSQQIDLATDLKKKLEDLAVYHDFFIYTYYDLQTLQKDCLKGVFSSVEEFQCKLELILHNYWIMFGETHKYTKAAKLLVKDCFHEVEELKLCKSCFFLSNTKPMKDWFCQPCDPPHQVVWAKQKGFDYWPAKVIQVEDNRLDVRFFGKHHPRAWLPIDAVRAIAVSPSELRVKRKQHWKQASAEMKEYIRQCECALGEEEASKIIVYDSPYGIGKNETLLKAMIALGKHRNGSLSSLNFDLNSSRTKKDSDSPRSPSLSLPSVKKEMLDNDCFPDNYNSDVSSNFIGIDETSDVEVVQVKKRPAVREFDSFNAEAKRRRSSSRMTFNVGTQTEQACLSDKHAQVNPSDFDGVQCSCKMRYSLILKKFKDYVIESNRLQKGKIIRAAAFKAAYEQRQVEDQTRKDVTAEFEEAITELQASHQKRIEELKTKQWCRFCHQEALLHCCRNTNYCSSSCKEKDFEKHKSECQAQSSASPIFNHDARENSQRPKRTIKPKLY